MDVFLRLGRLGPVAVGTPRTDVEATLGRPDAVSARARPLIWKYGGTELSFSDDRVALISLQFRSADRVLPAALGPSDAAPVAGMDLETFERWLTDAGIGFRADDRLTFGSQAALRVGAGVLAVFDAESGALDSLHYSDV